MMSRDATRVAVQIALVSLSSYLCGVYFTGFFHSASAGTGGLWAVMSGIVVLQETRRKTWSSAWLQILGTLVGTIISAAYLSSLPFSAIGMAVSIFATVLLCHASRIPDHARLAALAVGVVMVVSSLHPTLHPIQNAALRFSEACIGTAMAALAILMWPEPTEPPNSALQRRR
jgi:uncharacterized membrane protein YgaE (UPF0421/DUF939 family)